MIERDLQHYLEDAHKSCMKLKYRQALRLYEEAAIKFPDDWQPLVYQSYLHLLAGDFEKGLPLHEHRLRNPENHSLSGLSSPRWDGGPLTGKKILVFPEQGLGDTIQFVRFLPELKKLGAAKVLLGAFKSLQGLFKGSPLGIDTIVEKRDNIPPHDIHCALLSLPYYLRIAKNRIPAPVPYLTPKPEKADAIKQRLGTPMRPRIGVIWAGSSQFVY